MKGGTATSTRSIESKPDVGRQTKNARGRKVRVSGFKKAIVTIKKGQNIDLTLGI